MAGTFTCAVAVVGLVTVTELNRPVSPLPTETPGPKFACVDPWRKCVFWAVIVTVTDCPAVAVFGVIETIVGPVDD